MELKEIIEGNGLIAEFMGYVKTSSDRDFTFYEHPDGKGIIIQSDYDYTKFISHELMEIGGFIFHRSWDWLMQVVEKIDTMQDYRFTVRMLYSVTDIIDNQEYNIISEFVGNGAGRLFNTWNAVVEFINYYNHHVVDNSHNS